MRRSWFLALGLLLGMGTGTALWLRSPAAPYWLPGRGEAPPVLVILVGDRAGVASVRAAVAPERVLAATPDALAVEGGRVVAVSPEAAGGPLMQAGWGERPIELWSAAPVRPPAPDPVAAPKPGDGPPAAQATLGVGEAIALLRKLEATP